MKSRNSSLSIWRELLACALTLFAAGLAMQAADIASSKSPPNVLLIVSDDLTCALGCYGYPVVKTPNVDRLASQGVRFNRAYANYPVCNASRTSFLSGRYPETTQVLGNGTEPRVKLGPDFKFLPEYFKANGYFTAGIGKIAHGTFAGTVKWDVFADPVRGEEDDALDAAGKKAGKRAGKGKKAAAPTLSTSVPFGWQATENKDEQEPDGITARRVAKLLEEHKDKPFFIAAGFHKPHVPHTAPKKYFEMYPLSAMPLPIEPKGHAAGIPVIARPTKYFPDLTEEQKRAITQHYFAATTFMDAQLGVLLETMDRLKLWDNTVVVFLGDHGWHLGEHEGFWAKVSLMEESARAPLIIAAPQRKANQVCQRVVEFVDLFPTLVDLCGLAKPPGLEGASLAPLLKDPNLPYKNAVFSVVNRQRELGRAVRTEAYTYIEWPDGSNQLYDYRKDPKEYNNLARDPEQSTVVRQMKQILKDGWYPAGAAPR